MSLAIHSLFKLTLRHIVLYLCPVAACFFPNIFQIPGPSVQLNACNLVKNDKNISFGEFASTKDDGLYIMGRKEILSFGFFSVCQTALLFEQILKNEFVGCK